MYVIEVIPLVRATQAESLSYYASTEFPLGSLITVPLRKKDVTAVVVDTKPVGAAKTALRAATFSLRRLAAQEPTGQIPESLLKTATALTTEYPTSLGAVLYQLLPPDIRTGARPYPSHQTVSGTEDPTPAVLTGTTVDRMRAYKSYIREAFAHRGSVLLVVPSSPLVAALRQALEHGIEKRVVCFSTTMTKKQLEAAYTALSDQSTAKLIITTPGYAFLERHDITNIIIEQSASPYYQSRTRPYLDIKKALLSYAAVTGRASLLGDILPSSSHEWQRREEHWHTYDEHPKRLSLPSQCIVAEYPKTDPETNWQLITPTLRERTELSLQNKGHVFYYAPRRGLAPLVTCYDCGHVFRCPSSGAPYSLLRDTRSGEEVRWFVCSTSGRRERAADVCPDCGSWRLREQGVGIQQVEDAVKETFPKAKIIRFDHLTATTYRKATKLIEEFYGSKSVILIGTGMCLPYLQKPIDVTAITSYEAARAIPSWRADEFIVRLLLELREKTSKDCIIQTRHKPDELLKYAGKGLLDQFYDDDIAGREALSYPPFSHFVLMSYQGEADAIETIETTIAERLVGYELSQYRNPLPRPSGALRHTLLRVPHTAWPDPHLMEALRSLPPQIKIEIDPDRIV